MVIMGLDSHRVVQKCSHVVKKPGTADLELSKGAAPQLPDNVDDDNVSVDGCAEEEERWK